MTNNVILLNDTTKAINWGGNATSAGLHRIFNAHWPDGNISSLELQPLPFRKVKIFRRTAESRLQKCILQADDNTDLHKALMKLRFIPPDKPLPDRLYMNGESTIRDGSGHLTRLLAIAYYYKKLGVWTASINNTISLGKNQVLVKFVSCVFQSLDYITVREPISLRQLHNIGVNKAILVPDAAFSTPLLSDDQTSKHIQQLNLPNEYVCITASSILNRKSTTAISRLYDAVQSVTSLPVIMLSSTKTDIALGRKLCKRHNNIRIITPPVSYKDVLALLSRAQFLAGGRFHLTILAALTATPLLILPGNTHKMAGLSELLQYPLPIVQWSDYQQMLINLKRLTSEKDSLAKQLKTRATELSKQVTQLVGNNT